MTKRTFLFSLWVGLSVVLISGCSLIESRPAGEEASVSAPESETGVLIINAQSDPEGSIGDFRFTGVPTGTITTDSTLVVADLQPGTYTTTQVDPAPAYDLTGVECDDGDSSTPSSGDPSTRTAVFNLDPGETITCTFNNTRRGTLVLIPQTDPPGESGSFQFTGVPTGTVRTDGSLVTANLSPGIYSSTQVDPSPNYDLTSVQCSDPDSESPSSGDPATRTAIFNLDPGEMVTCTFVNTRRGTLAAQVQVEPSDADGSFQFTGVPTGTITTDGSLVVADLTPGTYTTTQVDPEPAFNLTAVECDDLGSSTPSSGDPDTRTAVYNLDPGETVTCTFTNTSPQEVIGAGSTSGGSTGSATTGGGGLSLDLVNPFEDPDEAFENFPLPDEIPPGAGTYAVPKPGSWLGTNFAGIMDCGGTTLGMPVNPPERGVLEVLEDGQTIIATGLETSEGVPITLQAHPEIIGRYTGTFQGTENGIPITIHYFWQLISDEYIVGFLTSSVSAEGNTCSLYRPFELTYIGP